ncbi:MAG: DUF5334 family protein [Desulfovibrionaceae bacterium]|nr:DUF5334 family protein [Desulfovibrionaceae bacterium]
MKYLLPAAVLTTGLLLPPPAISWDGFDADSADLVEITPDELPQTGDTVDVRNYDTDTTQTCLVEAVNRNARTIEVIVRLPDGQQRILVMEGR